MSKRMTVIETIKVWLAVQGKTQKELAEHLKITPQYLHDILSERRSLSDSRIKDLPVKVRKAVALARISEYNKRIDELMKL